MRLQFRKRYFGFIMALLLAAASVFPSGWSASGSLAAASPESGGGSLVLDVPGEITEWVEDRSRQYIYALSREANQLYFIRQSDLTLLHAVDIGSLPSDLVADRDKLYVSLDGANRIVMVDIGTATIERTIETAHPIRRLAKDTQHLYYAARTGSTIYKHHLETGTVTAIAMPSPFSSSLRDIEVNEDTGLLYAAGNQLIALDLHDTSRTVSQIPLGGYNFHRNIIADGDEAFFANRRFDADDLTVIKGLYTPYTVYHFEAVLQVSGRYVVTESHIYDRYTHRVMGVLPAGASLALLDASGNAYTVHHRQIRKSVVTLTEPSYEGHSNAGNWLQTRAPIRNWAANDEFIFAITTDNTLLRINKASLVVEGELDIGSRPIDVELAGNKLYLANRGSSALAVIDIADPNMTVSRIELQGRLPIAIAVYRDEIYIASEGLSRNANTLSVYSPDTGTVTDIRDGFFSLNVSLVAAAPELGQVYAADGNSLYSIRSDGAGNYTLNELVFNFGYRTSTLITDGDYIYAGTKKFSSGMPAAQLSGFPGQVIYAKGPYVFTPDAVYSSETSEKLFDLPFKVGLVDIDESGAIYLCRGNTDPFFDERSGMQRVYKFADMQQLESFLDQYAPGPAVFFDYHEAPELVEGLIVFEPSAMDADLEYYEIHALNRDQQYVRYKGRVTKDDYYDGYYIYEVGGFYPLSEVYWAVYGVVRTGDGNAFRLSPYSLARIWDLPTYLARDVRFADEDPGADAVAGRLQWLAAEKELPGDYYEVYFAGEDGYIGERLASVDTGQSAYGITLPQGTAIPDGALMLAVSYTDRMGEAAPHYMVAPLLDRMTRMPREQDITVNNRSGSSNDTIVIRNLQPGEKVYIYSEDEELLHERVVPPGSTEVTIPTAHLHSSGGYILVALQEAGKASSLLVGKAYGAEYSGPPPTGGGGGGVIPPPPPPVTGIPVIPVAPQEPADESEPDSTTAVVELEQWEPYLTDGKERGVIVIEAVMEPSHKSAEFRLSGEHMLDASDELKGKLLEFRSDMGALQLQAEDLLGSLSPGATLIVRIEAPTEAQQTRLTRQAQQLGAQVIGAPVNFRIMEEKGGKSTEIQPANGFWAHIIDADLPGGSASRSLAGAMYDPATNALIPVPATFRYDQGRLTGTLWRKGNSIYVLLEKNIAFSDLPSNAEAAASIRALASRLVITGYEDGTFRPERSVTRAEFAALLVRALGIVPQSGKKSSFSDVSAGNWFHEVAAAASEAGLIQGYGDGTFRPQRTITHAEMIVMIGNALKYAEEQSPLHEEQMADYIATLDLRENVPGWVQEALAGLIRAGIVKGGDAAVLSLTQSATREESAVYLYRLLHAVGLID